MKAIVTRVVLCGIALSSLAVTTLLAGFAWGYHGAPIDISGSSWSSGPDQFLSVNVSQGTPVRATAHGRIKSTSNSYAWDSHATDLTPWVGVMEDVEMPLWVVSLNTRQTVQVAGETNASLIWGMSSYYYSAEAAHVGYGRVDGVSLVWGGGHLLVGNGESDFDGFWDHRTSSTDGFLVCKRTRSSGSVTNQDSTGWPTHTDTVSTSLPVVIIDFANHSDTLRLVHRPFTYAFPDGTQFNFGHEVSLGVNTVDTADGKITGFAIARDLASGHVLNVFMFN